MTTRNILITQNVAGAYGKYSEQPKKLEIQITEDSQGNLLEGYLIGQNNISKIEQNVENLLIKALNSEWEKIDIDDKSRGVFQSGRGDEMIITAPQGRASLIFSFHLKIMGYKEEEIKFELYYNAGEEEEQRLLVREYSDQSLGFYIKSQVLDALFKEMITKLNNPKKNNS
jgi:hypothetical protein